MPRHSTGFDRYVAKQMEDGEFRREYESARREIGTIDDLVRALDAAREAQGMSKAELATRVGMKPELVRRLFTADGPNPTIDTVLRLVTALDCRLALEPVQTKERGARAKNSVTSARTKS